MDARLFTNQRYYRQFISNFERAINDNKNEVFVKYHEENHDSEFPIWVAVELFSFGALSKFHKILERDLQEEICKQYYYEIPSKYLSNWMRALSILRNTCAHRARLYNRGLPIAVSFSNSDQSKFKSYGYKPNEIGKSLFFNIVILDRIIGDHSLRTTFRINFSNMLKEYSTMRTHAGHAPRSNLGFLLILTFHTLILTLRLSASNACAMVAVSLPSCRIGCWSGRSKRLPDDSEGCFFVDQLLFNSNLNYKPYLKMPRGTA